MSDITEGVTDELGRKYGPLPLVGWFAIAGVSIVAVVLVRRRLAGRTGAPAEPAAATGNTAGAGASIVPGGFVIGGGAATPATGSTGGDGFAPIVTGPPKTNSDWSAAAVRHLIGKGYQPTIAQHAVSMFLSGQSLTAQQQAMIDEALASLGPTPTPVPPPLATPDGTNPVPGLTGASAATQLAYQVLGDKVTYAPNGPGTTPVYVLTWDPNRNAYKFGPDAPVRTEPAPDHTGKRVMVSYWPGGSTDGYISATNSYLRRA